MATTSAAPEKWCPQCQQHLPVAVFGADRSRVDGLTAYCRRCHRLDNRRRYAAAHPGVQHYHTMDEGYDLQQSG